MKKKIIIITSLVLITLFIFSGIFYFNIKDESQNKIYSLDKIDLSEINNLLQNNYLSQKNNSSQNNDLSNKNNLSQNNNLSNKNNSSQKNDSSNKSNASNKSNSSNKSNLVDKNDFEKNTSKMSIDKKVEYVMSKMTLEEKIGQMLIIYYSKDYADSNLLDSLHNNNFGGVILMKNNITTYSRTKKFVNDLKSNSSIPLIISIDQEGGSVQRLKNLKDVSPTDIPFMFDLGKMNNVQLSYQVGKVMAEELRTIGVNVVYAPVIDIYSNSQNTVIGKRSFGSNAEIVSKMSISLSKGLESNGIIATYKHFPGHGDTAVDSHYDLPIVHKNYENLKDFELKPFYEAINNDAKIIMVGHIALPNIVGDNTPASLSKTIITDILQGDMGYQGLVITDALNMGALTKNYSYEEIYTKAIDAGVDLLLMPKDSTTAIQYIKKNISEERINKSVKKILTFKYTYLNEDNSLDISYLGNKDHKKIISSIAK